MYELRKQGRTEEANKIFLALERLLPKVPDRSVKTEGTDRSINTDGSDHDKKDGWVKSAFDRCEQLIKKTHTKKAGYNEISEHSQMGIWGENVAVEYLRDKGYIILERDWRSGHRDIDIITVVGALGTPHPTINHIEDVDIMR